MWDKLCIISKKWKIVESLKAIPPAGASPKHREPEQKLVLEIFEPMDWFKYFIDSEGYIIGENPYWKGLKNNK